MTKLCALTTSYLFLVCVSAQAAFLATFESPTYTAGNVNGQNGWTVTAGSGAVSVNSSLDGSQLLLLSNGTVDHATNSADLGSTTVVSFLANITAAGNFSEFTMTDTSNTPFFTMAFDSGGGGEYYYFTSPSNRMGFTPIHDSGTQSGELKLTATLNFSAGTYDLLFQDLTNSTSHLVTGLTLSPTLATAAGTFSIFSQNTRADDVQISAVGVPEPTSMTLLSLGCLGLFMYCQRKTFRR